MVECLEAHGHFDHFSESTPATTMDIATETVVSPPVSSTSPPSTSAVTTTTDDHQEDTTLWKLAVFVPASFIIGCLVPVLAIVCYVRRFRHFRFTTTPGEYLRKKNTSVSKPKKKSKVEETSFMDTVKMEVEEEQETPKRVNFRSPIDIMNLFKRNKSPPSFPTESNGFKNFPIFDDFKKESNSDGNSERDSEAKYSFCPSLEGKTKSVWFER